MSSWNQTVSILNSANSSQELVYSWSSLPYSSNPAISWNNKSVQTRLSCAKNYYDKTMAIVFGNGLGEVLNASYIADSSTTVTSLRLTFVLKGSKYGTQYNFPIDVKIYLYSQKVYGASSTDAWTKATGGTVIKTVSCDEGNNTVSITFTSQQISKVMNYGIGFAIQGTANTVNATVGPDITIGVKSCDIEMQYTAPTEPPKITVTSPLSDTYSCDVVPCASIPISWTYSQSASEPATFDIKLRNHNGLPDIVVATNLSSDTRTYSINANDYAELFTRENELVIMTYIVLVAHWRGQEKEFTTLQSFSIWLPQAKNLSPNGGVLLFDESARFAWVLDGAGGVDMSWLSADEIPAKFDLQISTNGGESWTDIVVGGSSSGSGLSRYYDAPANTLPFGVVLWRVCILPFDTVRQARIKWSQASFTVRIQASTSAVTCDGKPNPTLSWASASQVAYQVRFADYDSGAIYSTAQGHRIPYVYGNGNYAVQVRTQASDGNWSGWTEMQYVQITNVPPAGSITLDALKTNHAVALSWTAVTGARYVLYRNDVPIYTGTDTGYTDVGANGETEYYIRAVGSDGYFIQSDSVEINVCPASDCIYDVAGVMWIPLRHSLGERVRGYSMAPQVFYKHYLGRTFPIAFTDGYCDRSVSLAYAFRSRSDAERLCGLSGHEVVFKDTRGGVIRGIVGAVAMDARSIYCAVSFTISEIDSDEAVRYELQEA